MYSADGFIDHSSSGTMASTSTFTIGSNNSAIFYNYGGTNDPSWKPSRSIKVRGVKKKRGSKDNTGKRLETSPMVIFKIMKKKLNIFEISRLNKRLEQISEVLENIPKGQIAMTEKFEKKAMMVMREAEMASCGFNKFISESILDNFIDVSHNRKVKLTKLKNYARFIPKNVLKKLKKAEDKKLFDGYLVAHTDPNNESIEKTEEDKKDPILFGVIEESSKYYFLADWEDELCDLTLDKIVDKLGLDKDDYTMDEDFGVRFKDIVLEGDDE